MRAGSASKTTKNVLWLQILQLSTFIVPLVTQPWIARALGAEGYGTLAFVLAIYAYCIMFIDFGFNWSATRTLAMHKDDRERRSQIVCLTIAAKFFLAIAATVVLLVVGGLASQFGLAMLSSLVPGLLGSVLSPIWYFQAIERPQVPAIVDLVCRSASIPVTFSCVRTPHDLWVCLLIVSATQFAIGVIGFGALAKVGDISWRRPPTVAITRQLRSSFSLFLSMSSVSLYTTANTIIVGIIARAEELAFFSAAQKIVSTVNMVFVPINQAVYPRVSYLLSARSSEGRSLIRVVFKLQMIIGLCATVILFFFSSQLISLVFGKEFANASFVLMALSPVPFLLGCASVFSNLVLLPLGQDKRHLRMVVGAAVLNLALIIPLVSYLGACGAAIAVCVAEAFVLCYAAHYGRKLLAGLRQHEIHSQAPSE